MTNTTMSEERLHACERKAEPLMLGLSAAFLVATLKPYFDMAATHWARQLELGIVVIRPLLT